MTTRVRVEALRREHAAALFDSLQDRKIYSYIPQKPPASIEALSARYERLANGSGTSEEWRNWVMFDAETNAAVGTLQATIQENRVALIAYLVLPPRWRCGFASDGVRWMIDHLETSEGINSYAALIDTRNEASIGLVERLGFARVARIENADFFDGRASHEYRYELVL